MYAIVRESERETPKGRPASGQGLQQEPAPLRECSATTRKHPSLSQSAFFPAAAGLWAPKPLRAPEFHVAPASLVARRRPKDSIRTGSALRSAKAPLINSCTPELFCFSSIFQGIQNFIKKKKE